MQKNNKQGGFLIQLIILIVAIVFIASFFNFDLKSFIEAPATQNNIGYVVTLLEKLWHGFLEPPIMSIWNNYLSVLVKDSFTQGLNNLKAILSGNINQLNLVPTGGLPEGWTLPQ